MSDKVYIILVNYRNFEDTIECLESVLKSDYADFQVFIIDNSPDNTSVDSLLAWINNNDYNGIETSFKQLIYPLEHKPVDHIIVGETEFGDSDRFYENKVVILRAKNNGFAAANNIVLSYLLKKEKSPYLVWMLNNDTVVEKYTLNNLVSFYQQNENKKVILCSKLKYYNNPGILQAVAGYYNVWIGKHIHIGDGEEDTGQYNNYKPGKNNYMVGASIFLPKLFLEQAGIMCEDYFLYFEELDWVQTGLKKGFTMSIVPNAIVYHKHGASIIEYNGKKTDTSLAEYYSIINRVKFIKKWYPYCMATVLPGVAFALIKSLFYGRFSLVKKSSLAIFKILSGRKVK